MSVIGRALLSALCLWFSAAVVVPQVAGGNDSSNDQFTLQIPVSGIEGVDWIIGQYYDHDATGGVRDYRGGSFTYNEHHGVDFGTPSFRWMDGRKAGETNSALYEKCLARMTPCQVFALAAANGQVVLVHDGEFDRSMSITSASSNRVEILHANGFKTLYLHLKKGSVDVEVGETVTAGQRLGVLGSSGKSDAPHLHFAVHNRIGKSIDPFLEDLWENPPAYDLPMHVADYTIVDRSIEWSDVVDPEDNIASIAPGEGVLGIGLSIAGVSKNDRLEFFLKNGGTNLSYTDVFGESYKQYFYPLNWPIEKRSGTWVVEVYTISDGKRKLGFRHEVKVRR